MRDTLITGKAVVVPGRGPAPEQCEPGRTTGPDHDRPGPGVKVRDNRWSLTDPSALRDAWIEFLSPVPFQWFATLTFETNVHPEAAMKRFRRFTNAINRSLYGRRWMKRADRGIYWIVAIERQKRGVVHLHALLGDTNDLNVIARRLTWMDYWGSIAGFARIEAVRGEDAAIRYVTKYVIKGGDIEFSSNLGQFIASTFPAQLKLAE